MRIAFQANGRRVRGAVAFRGVYAGAVFNISPLEIMVIAVVALIVLGPQRLPEMARSVGRGMREFRAALTSERDDEDDELERG
jgi:sec-independent protein translocase protein TatA